MAVRVDSDGETCSIVVTGLVEEVTEHVARELAKREGLQFERKQ